MMTRIKRTCCPVCGSDNLKEVFSVKNIGLARYGLSTSELRKKGELELDIAQCGNCALAFNKAFEYDNIAYDSELIQEAKHFSEPYKRFMDQSFLKLKSKLPETPSVLEIGCGDGYFLNLFKNDGAVCKGYEPSEEAHAAKQKGLDVENGYFNSEASRNEAPDLIIMRQVLEHLDNPASFVSMLYAMLSKGAECGYVYIEVPNGSKTFELNRFPDLYYEHFTYFSVTSLVYLLERSGFSVLHCTEEFDSEVLTVFARAKKPASSLQVVMDTAKTKVSDMVAQGLNVCGWGVAGNGTAFLDYLEIDSHSMEFIIDSDVRKQGMYLPATGQLVVSPEYFVNKETPDVFLIFTQFHLADIKSQIERIYPEVKIIHTIESLCE